MRFREKALNERVSAGSSPSPVPLAVQTGAKARGFSPTALEFTAETDSPLEGAGFELSVPGRRLTLLSRPATRLHAEDSGCRSERGSARFLLFGAPFHRADRPHGLGGCGLRCCSAASASRR